MIEFVLPPIENLGHVVYETSPSVVSRLSYDFSVTESVSDFRDPYVMKENNYDNTNGIVRSLENETGGVSENKLKVMNLKWKNSCMISFGTFGNKICMDYCLGICGWK